MKKIDQDITKNPYCKKSGKPDNSDKNSAIKKIQVKLSLLHC